MAYRLEFTEDLRASVRRVAAEQLEGAVAQLAGDRPEDPVEAVHDVRKRLKKTRSLVRLARPGMRARDYRRENRALRDRGRALSGTRDADVMVETVDALHERFAGHEPRALFEAVRGPLAERAKDVREDAHEQIPAHAEALRWLRTHVDDWPVTAVDASTLADGLARSYARGRAAFAVTDAEPTAANLHEWRKRVKDLWYQLRLLRDVWPGVMKASADEAKALSRLLGDDHDLAVLAELLGEDPELSAAPAASRERLLELIEQRRGELLEQARGLGGRLYAESPKAFRRRLRSYARSSASEAAA
jgi:CHAD domain-containing protein